jgi:Tol biopolymer transport system component
MFSDLGDQIAFSRQALDETRIMAIRPDGSAIKELATGLPGTVTGLRWSPDGSALLARIDEDKQGDVTIGTWYLIDGDGSGFRRLDQGSGFAFGADAAWRPNGRHIATWGEVVGTQDEDGPPGLYIVDADGTNVRRLAGVANPVGIEWSPDGRQLAFVNPDGIDGPFRINIADIDESGAMTALHPLRLDLGSSSEWMPKWSPDGRQLAFLTEKDVRSHIGVVNADGTGYRIVGPELSDLAATNPTWSPDGRSLVVIEDQRGPRTASEGAWLIDVATGAQTEVGMPVDSWQRLAP